MNIEGKKQKINNGRWTRAEHRKFMEALDKYGKDWVKIEKRLKRGLYYKLDLMLKRFFLKMSKQDIDAFIGSDDESPIKISRERRKKESKQTTIENFPEKRHESLRMDKEKQNQENAKQIIYCQQPMVKSEIKQQINLIEIKQQPKTAVVKEIKKQNQIQIPLPSNIPANPLNLFCKSKDQKYWKECICNNQFVSRILSHSYLHIYQINVYLEILDTIYFIHYQENQLCYYKIKQLQEVIKTTVEHEDKFSDQ